MLYKFMMHETSKCLIQKKKYLDLFSSYTIIMSYTVYLEYI